MFTPLLLLLVCSLALPVAAQDRLVTLVGDSGVMLRSPSGETLVSLNPDIPLVPASILKIPLAQVALSTLGEDFRFETHFYRNGSGDLLIRGLGDPFLVSEEIARIANALEPARTAADSPPSHGRLRLRTESPTYPLRAEVISPTLLAIAPWL